MHTTSSSTRRRVIASVAALLPLSALAACGGGGGGGEGSGGGGQSLVAAWSATPPQLDPLVFTGLPGYHATDAYLANLFEFDVQAAAAEKRPPDARDLIPSLAESYELDEAGTTYTIELRDDAKSPAGNTMTADDVVWTFKRFYSDPKALQSGVELKTANVDPKKPMTKVDDDTVKYHLTAPSPIALSVLATGFMGIIDSTEAKKHVTDDDPWAGKWLAANTAGFGAYKVSSFKPDEEIRLEANPNYFGDKPDFTTVVIRNVPDGASRAQLLRSGEVDIATDLPLDQLADIDGSGKARVLEQPDVQRHNLVITSGDPELGDPAVRQAVSQAIDREGLVKAVYQGYAKPAQTAIHSALFDQDPALTSDPAAAKDAIAKAAGGKRLSMELSISLARPGPYAETIARLIQADLAKVGVDVKINSVAASATFEGDVAAGKLQSYLYTERPSQPDPGFDLFLYLSSGSPLNNSGYSNPEFDKLSTTALTTPVGAKRDEAVTEAIGILENDLPLIPLVEVPYLIGVSERVDSAEHLPFGSPAFASITAAGS